MCVLYVYISPEQKRYVMCYNVIYACFYSDLLYYGLMVRRENLEKKKPLYSWLHNFMILVKSFKISVPLSSSKSYILKGGVGYNPSFF